jgi:2-keto-4-pentenoate hydratase
MKLLKYLILCLTLATHLELFAGEIELAEQLFQNYRHHQNISLISASHPNLSIEQAYIIQKNYVRKRLADKKPAGFKAGLTTKALQQKFTLDQALTGVLFQNGHLNPNQPIKLSEFQKLMLETELGFEIDKTIKSPLTNTSEFKQHIKTIFPVIEIPDLGFVSKPQSIDIIAANVGSAAFIKGKSLSDFENLDLNTLQVTLTQDGKVLNRGQGSDTLGNQWQAGLWLVNTVIAQGWRLEPGQFLITGAMGKMIPANIGNYQADFGILGKITFSIEP